MWVAVVCRYYSKITDALVVGWVVGVATFGAAAVVKAMVGWIKWPQFARDKYLTHVKHVVYNWCGSLKILFL